MIPSNLSRYKRWLVVVSVPDLLDRQTDTHNTHPPTHTHTHTRTHTRIAVSDADADTSLIIIT